MGNKKGIETVFRYSLRILAYQGHVHWSKISLYRQSPLSPSRHVFLRFSGRPISLCSYARRFSLQFLEIRVLYLIFIRYSKCNTTVLYNQDNISHQVCFNNLQAIEYV